MVGRGDGDHLGSPHGRLGDGAGSQPSGGATGIVLGRRGWEPSPGVAGKRMGFASLNSVIGYRCQPAGHGWLFRIGLTLFFGFRKREDAYPDRGFLRSLRLSVGRAF